MRPVYLTSRASVPRSNSQSSSSAVLASPPSPGSSASQLPAPCPPPVLEASASPISSQQSDISLDLGESSAKVSPPSLESDPPQLLTTSVIQHTTSLTIWEEVFCKVNNETTKWIQIQELDSLAVTVEKPDQIQQLTDLIIKKEKMMFEKSSPMKIKIGKQEIIFRAYIADVVNFLTMAGDVAMKFTPPQASAPWAAAKAVLKIPVKHIEQMAALAGIVQLFTRIVCRGQMYEVLYDNAISAKDGTILNLRSALVDLYASAIELLARCDTLLASGMVSQTLNAILRPEQVSDLISDLSKKEQILSYEVQSCEALRNAKATKQLDEKLETLLARLDVTSSSLTRTDGGVAKMLENVENDKLEKLMDFISSEQFGKGHATMKDTRIQGTSDWLIDHDSFREWQAIASSVGTGKTYLTSRVIDHIKQTLETSPHDEGFAFFYCNQSGPSMQDPLIVLRSFVRQLSYKANNYSYIQSNVIQRCEKATREGRGLSYTDCTELILESINLYSKTTIILDALDESDVSSYNLAEIVVEMMDRAMKPVKVFIPSRPDREYLEVFKDRATIKVDSSNQEGDIKKYLDDVLYSTRFFIKRRIEIQEMIKETFRDRNGGMFRWVYLQTKSLRKCVSDDAIRTWVKTIPRDLMAAYDRLWEDIKSEHNESDMELAMRAIKFAHEGDCLIKIKLRTEQEILTLCQDLQQSIQRKNFFMAPNRVKNENKDHKLFENYATNNWFNHVQRYDKWLGSSEDTSHEPALKRFLGSPGESSVYYRRWMKTLKPNMLELLNLAIPLMCRYGFYHTLRDWWEKDKIDHKLVLTECKRDRIDRDPLYSYSWSGSTIELAALGGCLPMCRYLINAIGTVGLRRGLYHQAAEATIGNNDIIKLLVEEAKVDVNVNLVDQGWVSPNQQGGLIYDSALITAALNQNLPSLEILLRAGADANIPAKRGEYGTALIAAASSSFLILEDIYTTIIVTLLKSGADINQIPLVGRYGSALKAFIWGKFDSHVQDRKLRHREILKPFLKSGADPAMICNIGEHGSALAASAFYGMKNLVVMMIDATGKERAIECFRQSRHPSEIKIRDKAVEAWKKNVAETATYLADEVGVDKETLRRIGIQDVKIKHGPDQQQWLRSSAWNLPEERLLNHGSIIPRQC
ncbi:hypothetical protein ACQKWADRAFT_321010 [Trichoderma austrokoningii]